MLNCQILFPHVLKWSYDFSPLFCYVMNNTSSFNVEPTLQSWDKPYLVLMCCNCWIQFAIILYKIFLSTSWRTLISTNFFCIPKALVLVLCWPYKMNWTVILHLCVSRKFNTLDPSNILLCYNTHTIKFTIFKSYEIPYFVVYNEHFLAQMYEGKIRMCIIHG